jgi:hypothetical protein
MYATCSTQYMICYMRHMQCPVHDKLYALHTHFFPSGKMTHLNYIFFFQISFMVIYTTESSHEHFSRTFFEQFFAHIFREHFLRTFFCANIFCAYFSRTFFANIFCPYFPEHFSRTIFVNIFLPIFFTDFFRVHFFRALHTIFSRLFCAHFGSFLHIFFAQFCALLSTFSCTLFTNIFFANLLPYCYILRTYAYCYVHICVLEYTLHKHIVTCTCTY